uniref:Uncharacterized protein n=1 Tax=Cucumis melo TaxID=3656 RepID=A0A9I9CI70_CUCME
MGTTEKGRRGQNEIPLPPSVYQRLTSSPTLLNLAQALAYHRMSCEDMLLQELQATQEQQSMNYPPIVDNNLSFTDLLF